MLNGPVLVVDDDEDDQEFLLECWTELGYKNELLFFKSGEELLNFLKEDVHPFLVLSDVNLPKMNGFELKEKLRADKRKNIQSIPFIFWSTEASLSQIKKSYELGGNGFFMKGSNLTELKESLIKIVGYWKGSKVPD